MPACIDCLLKRRLGAAPSSNRDTGSCMYSTLGVLGGIQQGAAALACVVKRLCCQQACHSSEPNLELTCPDTCSCRLGPSSPSPWTVPEMAGVLQNHPAKLVVHCCPAEDSAAHKTLQLSVSNFLWCRLTTTPHLLCCVLQHTTRHRGPLRTTRAHRPDLSYLGGGLEARTCTNLVTVQSLYTSTTARWEGRAHGAVPKRYRGDPAAAGDTYCW